MIPVCLIIGYLFGCVLFAVPVAELLYHKDIFRLGTGNPGMANVMAQLGFRAGLLVLTGDLLKTAVPCLVLRMIYGEAAAAAWTGLGAVLGHMYPFWHRFRGGKGVACCCAAIFCVFPLRGLAAMTAGLLTVLLSHYLAVGSVVIPTVFSLIVLLSGAGTELMVPVLFLAAVVWIRHLPALGRILDHAEKRFDLIDVIRKHLPSSRD